ncbi:hypothetical protein K488DRAFT_52021, partial [Vararia minispora EC-137]
MFAAVTHPSQDSEQAEHTDKFWNLYLKNVEEEDKNNIEDRKGDTDGILTFTGLFIATVAAFVIESSRQLSSNPGDETVALLRQIAGVGNSTPTPVSDPSLDIFTPPATAIVVNTFWFLSLILSLICALGAILMRQWTRNYQRKIQHRRSTEKRAILHVILINGMKRFGLDRASSLIIAILHVAVTFFIIGLVIFLFPINPIVAGTSLGLAGTAACAYLLLTVLPFFYPDCPFSTPFTSALALLASILLRV